jgi:hypothetical protein
MHRHFSAERVIRHLFSLIQHLSSTYPSTYSQSYAHLPGLLASGAEIAAGQILHSCMIYLSTRCPLLAKRLRTYLSTKKMAPAGAIPVENYSLTF